MNGWKDEVDEKFIIWTNVILILIAIDELMFVKLITLLSIVPLLNFLTKGIYQLNIIKF